MATVTTEADSVSPSLERIRRRFSEFRSAGGPKRAQIFNREGLYGWIFVSPLVAGLLVFLAIPVLMSILVSLRDWNGFTGPFDSEYVGFENYRELLFEDGTRRTDFAISIRNNLYYVLGVVPAQTLIALVLAVILNQKALKAKSFFRTAYYFPSITSSIAVSLIFIFLFQRNGAVNLILPIQDINWLNNANGLIHNFLGVLGIDGPPGWMETEVFSLSLWEWISGPSIALLSIMILVTWTTTGTFMLIFLAALQNISPSIEEAASLDGATWWQRFRFVTVPMMKPTITFVVTLGLIGTWQVFDQIFAISFGGPQKTTLTPAFLTYFQTFQNGEASVGAAIAVLLFFIIMAFTLLQRWLMRDEGV
ncbi:MAG: sugar ABC transporter permease [Acidimicrobiia bacterium]|nr:sugar ABC transporter permease [Acidimicrobiia bacterium]MDH5521071.1 sugar ABC transporter permease [Acidimicrobiia bacterium]